VCGWGFGSAGCWGVTECVSSVGAFEDFGCGWGVWVLCGGCGGWGVGGGLFVGWCVWFVFVCWVWVGVVGVCGCGVVGWVFVCGGWCCGCRWRGGLVVWGVGVLDFSRGKVSVLCVVQRSLQYMFTRHDAVFVAGGGYLDVVVCSHVTS